MPDKMRRLELRLSCEQYDKIKQKMQNVGIQNMSAYIRKQAIDGYCIRLDLSAVNEMTTLLRRCSNNLNQYAKRANETDSIYAEDIKDVQELLEQIWQLQKQLLVRLAMLK